MERRGRKKENITHKTLRQERKEKNIEDINIKDINTKIGGKSIF